MSRDQQFQRAFQQAVEQKQYRDLAKYVQEREVESGEPVPGCKAFTLRLDGKNFGRVIKEMRKAGLLTESTKYSQQFAEAMKACTYALVKEFGAKWAFTQSDEISLCVPPAPELRGVQHPHMYAGRRLKLCTLAASLCTGVFLQQFPELAQVGTTSPPCFDCRLGVFESLVQAQGLLMWRAHDCHVNGISDAIHGFNKSLSGDSTANKLKWLEANDYLPLPSHQRYGTWFYRTLEEKVVQNPLTGQNVSRQRWVIKDLSGPLTTPLKGADYVVASRVTTSTDVSAQH